MATRIEITCVVRSSVFGASERIRSVGGTKFNGERWQMSQEGAVRGIEDGEYVFYIHREGRLINVIVGMTPSGQKYLKAFADLDQPNYLLALPDCPWLG